MKTIIFKSEKKAKAYEIRSAKNQGSYAKGELIMRIKTDKIDEFTTPTESNQFREVTATELAID
jgi:hypothetical protein